MSMRLLLRPDASVDDAILDATRPDPPALARRIR
jgi:hypothetical protein